MSDPVVARLRKLDCCAVSDAFDRLGFKGVVTGVPQRSGASSRIAGKVATLKLHTGAPPPGPLKHLGTTAIEESDSDHVIVVEQRTGIDAGCWGGILTLGAKTKGIAGVIADGPVRDIDEAIEYQFPIYSTALTAITARGRISEAGTNVPVCVWGVHVNPGDYVIADNSAVVFIPADKIEQVIDTAETIVAKEKAMADAIRSGLTISEVMGGNYENMLKG
jgi:regulator of RNase E activity RraA